jgi:hypothetical protein
MIARALTALEQPASIDFRQRQMRRSAANLGELARVLQTSWEPRDLIESTDDLKNISGGSVDLEPLGARARSRGLADLNVCRAHPHVS